MKKNIKEIVSQMTLEEKAGLCSGRDFWHLKGIERLGVPGIMVSDGPHGLRKQNEQADHLGIHESIEAVCFPAACATAASFDEDLLETLGRALGEECRAEQVAVLLGPALNIKRSPLCGRNFEYFSEDPYLAGKLAAAQVRGVQSWGVGACPKHFAANNQEYRRMTCSSQVEERALREIYLAAFETVVKEASPWTMMCSYNRVNGEFASENKRLLEDILREEWGFDGFVMSDWGAVCNRLKGLCAGLELEMPGPCDANDRLLAEAVREGRLDEAALDCAAERILNIVQKWDGFAQEASFDRDAHHALAVRIEKQCAVLLQNNGVLPLKRGGRIAYIGGFAKAPRYQGGGSSHIRPHRVTGALECAGDGVSYREGFGTEEDILDEAMLQEAVKAAQEAEAAVIFAGLPDSFESEGYDRRHMCLPECQNELIRRVSAVQKNTVVVLHVGSPVETPWAGGVAAVLCMYLGGEGVGEAADALLYGDAEPCGRLPETWPVKLSDNPSYLNFPGDGKNVNYAEGVFVGYRYYDRKQMPVRWPFGHGLSYTGFSYGPLLLSAPSLEEGGSITASVEVANTGGRPGTETVQLYVEDRTGTPGRPEKELKGFAKLTLAPGERRTAHFTINTRSLAYYQEELGDWFAASGRYGLLAGSSSRNILAAAELNYTALRVLPLHVDENTTLGELLSHPATAGVMKELLGRFRGALGDGGGAISAEMTRQMIENAPLRALKGFAKLPDEALQNMISRFQELLAQRD